MYTTFYTFPLESGYMQILNSQFYVIDDTWLKISFISGINGGAFCIFGYE